MGAQLQQEFENYKAVAQGFVVDHKDIDAFTAGVLGWWANHGSKIPAWAEAARVVFSFTPNSAAAERVFSLLKIFFTDMRDSALADIIQATLMLRYNKRKTGNTH